MFEIRIYQGYRIQDKVPKFESVLKFELFDILFRKRKEKELINVLGVPMSNVAFFSNLINVPI